jgi:hypothetical protein
MRAGVCLGACVAVSAGTSFSVWVRDGGSMNWVRQGLRGSTGVEDQTGVGMNSLLVSARGREVAEARERVKEKKGSTWFRRALRQEVPKIGRHARKWKPTRGPTWKGSGTEKRKEIDRETGASNVKQAGRAC